MDNPFRIAGPITGSYFTNRAAELTRIVAVLREPQAKLVVYGPRRMGKSSALEMAKHRAERRHQALVIFADASTASGEADIATRVMQAAVRSFGKRWQDAVKQFAKRLSVKLSISIDSVTGTPSVGMEPSVRDASNAEQGQTLGEVLDAVDEMAGKRSGPVGIMVDEFQEIHRYGGEAAEWRLRGVIQRHKHLSYVLAGSRESLIMAMTSDKNRAFYELADRLHVGPIAADHMATWIDQRFERGRVRPDGIGGTIVATAGPRTRDRVRLARATYSIAAPSKRAQPADVTSALDNIAEEQSAEYAALWRGLSPTQQNVLRAVAAGTAALFRAEVRERFALGKATGSTAKAVARLVELEHLARAENGTDYVFDSPFFGHWVATRTLVDVGSTPVP